MVEDYKYFDSLVELKEYLKLNNIPNNYYVGYDDDYDKYVVELFKRS